MSEDVIRSPTTAPWVAEMEAGQFQRSAEMLRQHLLRVPEDLQQRTRLAIGLAMVGDFMASAEEARVVLEEQPGNLDARICLVRAMIEMGFEEEAEEQMASLRRLGCTESYLLLLKMRLDELKGHYDCVLDTAVKIIASGSGALDALSILNRAFDALTYDPDGRRLKQQIKKFSLDALGSCPLPVPSVRDVDAILLANETDRLDIIDGLGGPGGDDISTLRIVAHSAVLAEIGSALMWARLPRIAAHTMRTGCSTGAMLNEIVEAGNASYIVLLTPDVLLPNDAIGRLVDALVADPRAAILGPVSTAAIPPVQQPDTFGESALNRRRVLAEFNQPLGLIGDEIAVPAPMLRAGLTVISRAFLDQVGGFAAEIDEANALVADLCLRATKGGYGVRLLPNVLIGRTKPRAPQMLPDCFRPVFARHDAKRVLMSELLLSRSQAFSMVTKIAQTGAIGP